MASVRTSWFSRFRRDDIDLKARNVKRESNCVTALSRRAKLLAMSRYASVRARPDM